MRVRVWVRARVGVRVRIRIRVISATGLLDELHDRYGPIPPTVATLVEYGRLRVLADELGVETMDRDSQQVVLKFRDTTPVDPVRLVRFVERRGDLRLKPPATLFVDLRAPGDTLRSGGNLSWWTDRARSADVRAGFSRTDYQREARRGQPTDDLFGRISDMLVELGTLRVDG